MLCIDSYVISDNFCKYIQFCPLKPRIYLPNGSAKRKSGRSSAIRISSLYFAIRSEREREPVLI